MPHKHRYSLIDQHSPSASASLQHHNMSDIYGATPYTAIQTDNTEQKHQNGIDNNISSTTGTTRGLSLAVPSSSSFPPSSAPPLSPISPSAPLTADVHVCVDDTDKASDDYCEYSAGIYQCRICLSESTIRDPDLIVPCLCSGTGAYVHRQCLDEWRAQNMHHPAFHECTTCHFKYQYDQELINDEQMQKRSRRYKLLVLRDIVAVILIIEAVLIFMAWFISVCDDLGGHQILSLFPSSYYRVFIYYGAAVLVCTAAFGLFGLIARCTGLEQQWLHTRDQQQAARMVGDPNGCGGCCWFSGGGGGLHHGTGGGGDGDEFMILIIIVLLILAVFGVFYGILYGSHLVKRLSTRHVKGRWYRSETDRFPVRDWTGHIEELRERVRKDQ